VAEVAAGIEAALGKLLGEDARAVELLGGVVNDGVLSRLSESGARGEVLITSREVRHPAFDGAVVRTPTMVGLSAADADVYESECFGPVSYLIATSGTPESIDLFRRTVTEHGAMTASVYSTSDAVIEQMRDAALDAGVALSENLTGQVFVNQTAAFSDFHGTGANPAANASYTDAAYIAPRFRVIGSRRHI
jgi:acyl-CoA reductase-like NAD-dependent aldehyde dehydrogenase